MRRGGPPPGRFQDWDREAWQAALDANLLAPVLMIRAVVDGMCERGFGRSQFLLGIGFAFLGFIADVRNLRTQFFRRLGEFGRGQLGRRRSNRLLECLGQIFLALLGFSEFFLCVLHQILGNVLQLLLHHRVVL